MVTSFFTSDRIYSNCSFRISNEFLKHSDYLPSAEDPWSYCDLDDKDLLEVIVYFAGDGIPIRDR